MIERREKYKRQQRIDNSRRGEWIFKQLRKIFDIAFRTLVSETIAGQLAGKFDLELRVFIRHQKNIASVDLPPACLTVDSLG